VRTTENSIDLSPILLTPPRIDNTRQSCLVRVGIVRQWLVRNILVTTGVRYLLQMTCSGGVTENTQIPCFTLSALIRVYTHIVAAGRRYGGICPGRQQRYIEKNAVFFATRDIKKIL